MASPPLPEIAIVLQRASAAPAPLVEWLEVAFLDHVASGIGLGCAA